MKSVKSLGRFWADESGLASVEYALLMALITGLIAISAAALGAAVSGEFVEATACVGTPNDC